MMHNPFEGETTLKAICTKWLAYIATHYFANDYNFLLAWAFTNYEMGAIIFFS